MLFCLDYWCLDVNAFRFPCNEIKLNDSTNVLRVRVWAQPACLMVIEQLGNSLSGTLKHCDISKPNTCRKNQQVITDPLSYSQKRSKVPSLGGSWVLFFFSRSHSNRNFSFILVSVPLYIVFFSRYCGRDSSRSFRLSWNALEREKNEKEIFKESHQGGVECKHYYFPIKFNEK